MSKRPSVAFICTGNICRSPMAEYLFRHQAGAGFDRVCSAGIMAVYGAPASRFGVKALKEVGLDLTPHRSQPVTSELVAQHDLLIVMTSGHREQLEAKYPEAAARIHLIKSFDPESDGGDVLDPIGLSLDVYRHVRDEIMSALWGVERFMEKQWPDGGKTGSERSFRKERKP